MSAEDGVRRFEEGLRLEEARDWAAAEALYAALLEALQGASAADRVRVMLRHANALARLNRRDDALGEFDRALRLAKESGDRTSIATAALAAGVFAAEGGDLPRSEGFLLAALDAFHRGPEPHDARGEGWAMLNLASVYGRTQRLDLAFLTFERGRERLFRTGDWIGVAAAWEMQAGLRHRIGDEEGSRQDRLEAATFFERAGRANDADRIRSDLPRSR